MSQLRCVHRVKLTFKELNKPLASQIPADEIESASSFAGQIRVAAEEQNGMKWFQIVGIVLATILLERLSLAILGHIFGRGVHMG